MNSESKLFLVVLASLIILLPPSIYGQVTVTDGATYVENQFVGQTNATSSEQNRVDSLVDSFVEEVIAISASIIGMGLTSLFIWLRKKGIEITPDQEKMFKQLLTERYKKLAKNTWQTFRENEEAFATALGSGKIPSALAEELKKEGKSFASELLEKKEFQDFSKNIAKNSVEKLLENIRTELKNENQKRMLDVLPKIAAIAVDAAFKENQSFEEWGKEAFRNIKPLMVNSEALEKESNIMLIIQAEINKRIQTKLQLE